MRTENVTFHSDGIRLSGLLRLPDAVSREPLPVVVQGPGWLGLADANSYVPWHVGLTDAGYAVLAFDYRGFGKSEGESGWVRTDWQLEDIRSAVTYAETRRDIDAQRIGAYGMGGTGGGNAIMAAAVDPRIQCVVAQSVVADGADWLRRMRREYEWVALLDRVAADRRRWVTEGTGEKVDPRQDLMVAAPEREELNTKKDVDHRIAPRFFLRTADYLMDYRPIDFVERIAPRGLLITSVKNDVVTPEDHAALLYKRAGAPKKLIHQTDTTHYRSYKDNYPVLLPQIVEWYDRFLRNTPIISRAELAVEEIKYLGRAPGATAPPG